jgi:hypothetical protein
MRASAELASSLIAGFGRVAARVTVLPAAAKLITALANKLVKSAAFLGFMIFLPVRQSAQLRDRLGLQQISASFAVKARGGPKQIFNRS